MMRDRNGLDWRFSGSHLKIPRMLIVTAFDLQVFRVGFVTLWAYFNHNRSRLAARLESSVVSSLHVQVISS
jgi:hypothetical protein